jgi:hypothetical protein
MASKATKVVDDFEQSTIRTTYYSSSARKEFSLLEYHTILLLVRATNIQSRKEFIIYPNQRSLRLVFNILNLNSPVSKSGTHSWKDWIQSFLSLGGETPLASVYLLFFSPSLMYNFGHQKKVKWLVLYLFHTYTVVPHVSLVSICCGRSGGHVTIRHGGRTT